MIQSVHDNFLVSYEVRCARREVVLHTEFRDKGEPFEKTDITFAGVDAYLFKHDAFDSNILFDVKEVEAVLLYREHADYLKIASRYTSSFDWSAPENVVLAYFQEQDLRGFLVWAAHGLCGWVFAQQMTFSNRD